jgi:Raf kinase inhibitor-like YbhB/YbcL family protein
MKTLAFLLGSLCIATGLSAQAAPLTLEIDGIDTQGFIKPEHAYCIPAVTGHTKPGNNINVAVKWAAGAANVKSYALVMVDEDVPADFSNANKEGKVITASQQRRPFYHWLLVNIPATTTQIPAGADSNGTAVKPTGNTQYGTRAINDYSTATEIHGGYDGPCPPWNDERIHNYHFRLYALSTATIDGVANMKGQQVMEAIKPYIIDTAEVVGKYTLNPALIPK